MRLDELESRTLLSTVPAGVDRGDYYTYQDEPVRLMQATDRVLLQVEAGQAGADVVAGLVAGGGLLAGGTAEKTGMSTYWTVDLKEPLAEDQLGALLNSLEAVPGVVDAAETFFAAEGYDRLMVTRDIVVALEPGVDPAQVFGSFPQDGYQTVRGTADRYVVTLREEAGRAVLAAAQALEADPRVTYATADFLMTMETTAVPNDPLLSNQWHLKNTGSLGGIAGADVNVTDAWEMGYSGQGVVIAIVDDSVQLDHPDLVGNLWINSGEIPGDGIDNDGNGWVDDIHGFDFIDYDGDPSPTLPDDNHGTAVAGVAAARGNNGLGVASPAYSSRIMGVRLIGAAIPTSRYAEAIYYMSGRTANGLGTWKAADVGNHSYRGKSPIGLMGEAFDWSFNNGRDGLGTIHFAGSGNDADVANYDQHINYPAGYSSVMAIGGSTESNARVAYSDYGPHLWLVTPTGGLGWNGSLNIETTDRTGAEGYNSAGDYTGYQGTGFNGTSSASPLAAGVGALVLSANPRMTAAEMRQVLRDTAVKIGPLQYDSNGWNNEYGYGRVNATAAVNQVAIRLSASTVSTLTENTVYRDVRVGTLALPLSSNAAGYSSTVEKGDGTTVEAELQSLGGSTYSVVVPSLTYQEGGSYPMVVRVFRDGQEIRVATSTVTVAELPIHVVALDKSLREGYPHDGSADLAVNNRVATFTDEDPDVMVASWYTALINWGDGTTSQGLVQKLDNGWNQFEVLASHAYSGGDYQMRVEITSPGNAKFVSVAEASVLDSPITVTPRQVVVAESREFSSALARIDDADPRTHAPSFYTAVIDYGDGPYVSKNVGGMIPDRGAVPGVLTSILNIEVGQFTIADLDVNLTIRHDRPSDLSIVLISPTGLRVPLVSGLLRTGPNITRLTLDDEASTSIGQASAPYTGSFQTSTPGQLARLDGRPLSGLWTLEITDSVEVSVGQLVSWSISAKARGTIVAAPNGTFDVYGQHIYETVGTYTPSIVVYDNDDTPTTSEAWVTVENAPITLTGLPIESMEGGRVSGTIGYMVDTNPRSNPDSFRVMIDWKDGSAPTAGELSMYAPSRYVIRADHVFDRPSRTLASPDGTFAVEVTLHEAVVGSAAEYSQTLIIPASVSDSPLRVTGAPFVVTEGGSLGSTAVVQFQDGDLNATASSYLATVNWGDGRTDRPATIRAVAGQPGVFEVVSGDDLHPVAGNYPVVVTITDLESGFSHPVNVAGRVLDAPIVATGLPLATLERTDSGLMRVAVFHDVNLLGSDTGQFQATIAWGDGTSSAGSVRLVNPITPTSPAIYEVVGQHTYAQQGDYTVTTTVASIHGSSSVAIGTTSVANILMPISGRLDAASDTGAFSDDGVTARAELAFTGEAEALTYVTVYAQAAGSSALTPVGQTQADAQGRWSLTTSSLPGGSYDLLVQAFDPIGVPASELTRLTSGNGATTFVVDTMAPRIASAVFDPRAGGFLISFADAQSGMAGSPADGIGAFNRSNYTLSLNNGRGVAAQSVAAVPGDPGSVLVRFGARRLNGRGTLSINSSAVTDLAGHGVVETFFTANPITPKPTDPWMGAFRFGGAGVVHPTQYVSPQLLFAQAAQRRLLQNWRR